MGRPRIGIVLDAQTIALRTTAEDELARVAQRDRRSDPRRAGEAANLLGVLALVDSATPDQQQRLNALRVAIATLQAAVDLDPSNQNAKFNLEVALRRLSSQPRARAHQQPKKGHSHGAKLTLPGQGY
jgi:hypothetical protein